VVKVCNLKERKRNKKEREKEKKTHFMGRARSPKSRIQYPVKLDDPISTYCPFH